MLAVRENRMGDLDALMGWVNSMTAQRVGQTIPFIFILKHDLNFKPAFGLCLIRGLSAARRFLSAFTGCCAERVAIFHPARTRRNDFRHDRPAHLPPQGISLPA